jgi:hypothetical protein
MPNLMLSNTCGAPDLTLASIADCSMRALIWVNVVRPRFSF